MNRMDWEQSNTGLAALFAELTPKDARVQQKKMFGWPCAFVNGNLFAGLHKQSMIFRLSDTDLAAFLKLDGAGGFEPMPGRMMKGYGILSKPLARDRNELAKWMRRSLEYGGSLPAKAKKPAKKK